MAIKINIGKLKLKNFLQTMVINFQTGYNADILDIGLTRIYRTQQLPLHHKDPFDRLIIAQSIIENIDIVSSDEIIRRLWS